MCQTRFVDGCRQDLSHTLEKCHTYYITLSLHNALTSQHSNSTTYSSAKNDPLQLHIFSILSSPSSAPSWRTERERISRLHTPRTIRHRRLATSRDHLRTEVMVLTRYTRRAPRTSGETPRQTNSPHPNT